MSGQPPVARWQSEQAPYPLDADYRGDSTCIFELEQKNTEA